MKNPRLPRRPLGVIFALALLALSPFAHAQWKWRDADGRVQYSDRPPPPNVAEKDIMQRPNQAARAPAPQSAQAPGAASAASDVAAPGRAASESSRDKIERERKTAEDKANKEAMAENCRLAQNRQRLLESGVRLRSGEPGGETQVMTEQARQEQIRQMQVVINTQCK